MAVLRISGGLIYDGSSNEPIRGDVWVKDDRIVSVGEGAPSSAFRRSFGGNRQSD